MFFSSVPRPVAGHGRDEERTEEESSNSSSEARSPAEPEESEEDEVVAADYGDGKENDKEPAKDDKEDRNNHEKKSKKENKETKVKKEKTDKKEKKERQRERNEKKTKKERKEHRGRGEEKGPKESKRSKSNGKKNDERKDGHRRPRSPDGKPPVTSAPNHSGEAESSAGRHCPICWKFVKGDLALHQATSLQCQQWSSHHEQNSHRPSVSRERRGKPEAPQRVPCQRCNKLLAPDLWSRWQHYQSMHPDNLDELDVPEDWRQWNDERRGFNLTLAVKKEPSPSPRPGRSKTRPREVRS